MKEPSFDDENSEEDVLMDSKIPIGRFARIIDEFEVFQDDLMVNKVMISIPIQWIILGFQFDSFYR